ncbi:GNAT family N-acetyltransferase [Sinomonas notoginsengisoli]|uniref:GNAT family N-acetyltransferase n=1 Tax=Sinomonas notoginsengisoli TaxID=1457311 RepID=UPI001F334289|nr:GNAT family N-acetyltransferase [Sinomonas notoginsengisoli]
MELDYEISDAVPTDAEALLAVKDACWREAYAHLLPAEFLAHGLGGSPDRTERWRGFLAHDAAGHFALVRRHGRVVGFAGAGPARPQDAPPQAEGDPGLRELYTAYILAEMYGTGAGMAVVERVLGDGPAILWVFEDNPRARAFYAKLGFTPDGGRKLDEIGGRRLAEIRMARSAQSRTV